MEHQPTQPQSSKRFSFFYGAHNERADFVLATEHDAVLMENARLQRENAALRQHKNDYMEAAEQTRQALTSDIDHLRPKIGMLVAQFQAILSDPDNLPDGYEVPAKVLKAMQWLADFAAGNPIPSAAFQTRVLPWLLECFGEDIAYDGMERNHRFLEEALELVQACGCTEAEALKLVSYVFGRPVGERSQEVGGVMVTLAALCLAHGLDMHGAGETELARISQPETITRIRMKQASKPAMSPLPGVYPERQPTGTRDEHQQ